MKIGLNCQQLLIDNPAGPERFTLSLYKHLAQVDTAHEYVMYFNAEPPISFLKSLIGDNKNFSYRVIKKGVLWTQIRLAIDLLINPVDIFFTPIHTFPFLRSNKTKFVVMIHGLEYKTNKELSHFAIKGLIHPWELMWVARNANKIVVPSQATRTAIINQKWTSDIAKITIISEGVENEFHEYGQKEVEEVLKKYDIEYKKYLLFVSTIQPRKNIVNLIQAFSKIKNTQGIKLVLIGKLGWAYDDILAAPKNFGVEDSVKFLNWVPQNDLPLIFSGAVGYTNVSFDEGFGLTLLEAMATGIPAVVSDIPAHREVSAGMVQLVDVNDLTTISNNLASVISGHYPKTMLENAKTRSSRYSWGEAAKKFSSLFSSIESH